MSVRLTGEVEAERLAKAVEARKKPTWEHYRTLSIVEAVHKARDMGWSEKKVQVRVEDHEFVVEPYEEGCGCSGLLKYTDYYGSENENDISK